MDEYLTFDGVIDPEVRAHVYSLVTALGGSSATEDGRYVLGDDALACLKDIKRWLKLHDEKLNRLDVTRCLAEAHLVKGDLLEIVGQWPEEAMDEKWRGRMALACMELLVPLTWPVEKDLMSEVTRNQHRHLPYIQVAQVTYKREILEHPSGDILKKAVRLALPSMATPGNERTPRDEGIIKLALYFIRNIAMISAPANLPVEWNEQEVSRSATIKAFEQQDVFAMLLTMASNVMTDFRNQDVVILEVLFHLIKGVDPKKLFMSKPQRSVASSGELKELMQKESDLLKSFAKQAPTRHNRFGTMVWVERDEAKRSTVTGQDVLRKDQNVLDKMDKSKKWNKPKRRPKDDHTHMTFDLPETLSDDANEAFRKFIEDFIDSSFNPLFTNLRKAIEREADRVLIAHSQQFWYLISWFLRAESERRKAKKENDSPKEKAVEVDSFGIVASVLNQETFILLNRAMQNHLDNKEWTELDATMRCFTQILLTVQEMADSPLDEDQEIAENIQNRIFYEESTHDRVLAILRGYKDQNFSYLDATTEMCHVFLRLLERYSKENGDLQIRSRRKARKKKKDDQKKAGQQVEENPNEGSEAEDEAQATQVTRERKFNFDRFAGKFVTQASVNTFIKFVSFYKDLSADQLKRAHRFFYRVAFKREMTVLLFRLDIIQLFNRMIKSSDSLQRSNQMFGEWTELVKQLFRRLVKKLKERPELAVELLFSKMTATCHYLEYGYEKQTLQTAPRAPAELEVRGGLSKEDQIGVVVAVLVEEQKMDALGWVSKQLRSAAGERQAWEDADAAKALEAQLQTESSSASNADTLAEAPPTVPAGEAPRIGIVADNEARRVAMFKDNKLRLLLTLIGAERIGAKDDASAPWYIPSELDSKALLDLVATVEQHKLDPKTTYGEPEDNPMSAAEMLKRKATARPTRGSNIFGDDDDEGLDDFLADDEFLFPAGGPTTSKNSALEELKSRRKRRQRRDSGDEEEGEEEIDEETRELRRKARALKELEKRRRIKSTEFVHESDEETDEERDREFFAREKATALTRAKEYDEAQETRVREQQKKMLAGDAGGSSSRSAKRKRVPSDGDESEDGGDGEESAPKKLRSSDDEALDSGSDSDAGMPDAGSESDEESLFVSNSRRTKKKTRKSRRPRITAEAAPEPDSSSTTTTDADADGDLEEEDETPFSSQSEPRVEKLALAETDGNRGQGRQTRTEGAATKLLEIGGAEEGDGEDVLPTTQRRRARLAVLDDSDDE